MDNLSPEQRRKNMQRIRSENTLPERLVMRELRRNKVYFSKYTAKVLGKPDILFRKKRVAVFIDSDFWHGNRRRFVMPASNREYWEGKIEKNKIRDKHVTYRLRKDGWIVLRFWDYDVLHNTDRVIRKILETLCIKERS